ncbi:MAG: hypothetical protein JNM12_13690 [Alphaproteobacteria bacterium]|nr:hypothetical protein [Alphaproteobacteria bacterium]
MRIFTAVFALLFAVSTQPALAASVDSQRTHVPGHFQLELNGTKEGMVKPIDGGKTGTSTTAPRGTGNGIGAQVATPVTNPKTPIQPPHSTSQRNPGACAKPPCTTQPAAQSAAKPKPAASASMGLGVNSNSSTEDGSDDGK